MLIEFIKEECNKYYITKIIFYFKVSKNRKFERSKFKIYEDFKDVKPIIIYDYNKKNLLKVKLIIWIFKRFLIVL